MKKQVTGYNRSGTIEFQISLPMKRIVCPTCNGSGTHVNPAIDGHGLSAEELDDPEFREAYMAGHFDVRCEECHGRNVVDEIDEEACFNKLSTWKGLIRYQNALRFESEARAEEMAERRMGA